MSDPERDLWSKLEKTPEHLPLILSLLSLPERNLAEVCGFIDLWITLRAAERGSLVLHLRKHWSTSQIARAIGVRRETLSRSRFFQEACKRIRETEGGDIPRGYKSADGDLDAVFDPRK